MSEGEPASTVTDITWQLVRQESYVTLASQDNKWAGKKITAKSFTRTPHIIVQQPSHKGSELEEELLRHELSEENLTTVSSSLTGLLLALETGGLVTIPKLHAEAITGHMAIAEIALPFDLPHFDIFLGWHRSFERDECHQWLRRQLLARFEDAAAA